MAPSMGAWSAIAALSIFVTVLCARQTDASKLVRGVAPNLLDKYKPVDGKFTCLDGSATLDFAQVNDNYCDCPDGSDEPGEG